MTMEISLLIVVLSILQLCSVQSDGITTYLPANESAPSTSVLIGTSLNSENATVDDQESWSVLTYPPTLEDIKWKTGPVELLVQITQVPSDVELLSLKASVDSTRIAYIEGEEAFTPGMIEGDNSSATRHSQYKNITFTVQPETLGRTELVLTILYQNASADISNGTRIQKETVKIMNIAVVRVQRVVDKVFQYCVYLLLVIVTFSMGAEISLQTVKETLRRPKAPVIALCSQFIIMPLLAYGIIRLVGYRGGTALGFFAMGCAPGGGPSNMYAHLLGGDLSISITMTFLSTILSIGMLPLWLYTLGTTFPSDGTEAKIPFVVIAQTIAVLSVPLAIGIIIQYKLPKVRDVLKKCLKVLMVIVVICLFTSGIITNIYIFDIFDPMVVLIGASLPYGGFILGGLAAVIFRMEWRLIKTIAIETGLQNAAVPFFMVQAAFSSPELELATVPVVSSIIMTPVPLLIATLLYTIYNKCCIQQQDGDAVPCPSLNTTYLDDSLNTEQKKGIEELSSPALEESLLTNDKQKPPDYQLTEC